jgi:hypothetical protein
MALTIQAKVSLLVFTCSLANAARGVFSVFITLNVDWKKRCLPNDLDYICCGYGHDAATVSPYEHDGKN